jgi:hypothetical protein
MSPSRLREIKRVPETVDYHPIPPSESAQILGGERLELAIGDQSSQRSVAQAEMTVLKEGLIPRRESALRQKQSKD